MRSPDGPRWTPTGCGFAQALRRERRRGCRQDRQRARAPILAPSRDRGRVETFKVSNDPHFEEKLVDVVGLYLDPPERAVVFSFDEKTQVQALDRTQPTLPMRPVRGRTMTHDYKRNGTTDLFAALNVGTGEVIYDCKKRHTAKDVLSFFKLIDLHVPKELDIHVVLDNLSAHEPPRSPPGSLTRGAPAGTSTSLRRARPG
jgi:hypothetical protein